MGELFEPFQAIDTLLMTIWIFTACFEVVQIPETSHDKWKKRKSYTKVGIGNNF